MQFQAAVARGATLEEIEKGLVSQVGSGPGGSVDLAVLFVSAQLRFVASDLARRLRAALQPGVLLGVSAEGVIGGDQEVENEPAASLLLGHLPGVTLQPFAVPAADWDELVRDDERLHQRLGTGEAHRAQLLLADPFHPGIIESLPQLDAVLGAPTLGGMASASHRPEGNVLLLNDRVLLDGAVGVGLGGALQVDPVVAQGCRPVGEPMVVTASQGPWVLQLRRQPALAVAQQILSGLPQADMELIQQNGLFVGVVLHEEQAEFHRGDFLVRGLLGANRENEALAVGEYVRPGQTIQFHVRDAAAAHEDLVELLRRREPSGPPAGALLFSCNGRGSRMFSQPHHDIRTTRDVFPGLPVAGFFAMGELGPVGGRTFVHGHTASLALFRSPA
ncbi:MAG: hypothetical protein FJX77_04735 [Armatimonadetes bacterium]|nr:hypothetical protein [Armatimonadota bacterium]